MRCLFIIATTTLLLAGSASADFLFKLMADDGAAGDHLGSAVAVTDYIVIVGADKHGDAGAAYIYDRSSGRQIAKIVPNDLAENARFGHSVAIDGNFAIIGANEDDIGDCNRCGSAYVYNMTNPRSPALLVKLYANDGEADEHFGASVGIHGATAIVGAEGGNDNGFLSGAAYLFDAVTGQQLFKLLPNDGDEEDEFGTSVAIEGALAIVGAFLNDDHGEQSGSAYVFHTPTGRQLAKLVPDDSAAGDRFGYSVAISGVTAIVGAYLGDSPTQGNCGSAYVFDLTNPADPDEVDELLATDGQQADNFGWSVGILGNHAVVGARLAASFGTLNGGAAYLFDVPTGQQIAKFVPSDVGHNDFFGRSVAVSNAVVVIASWNDDDNGENSGSAYLFQADASSCDPDIDEDGVVGAADLAAILGNWGPVPPNDPDADLNNDGVVGPADLAIVLGNWGPC